ncbi:transposase [Cohnella sp. GCM10027633]|uniref:transposase n=1 Tax=unclassified Cohnella TaxID=2636738 RepID=UPI00363D98AC
MSVLDTTFEAIDSLLNSEELCIQALHNVKWPEGFRCPKCSHPQCFTIHTRRLPLYECVRCGKQTSLISDTCFRGSRTPLTSWFKAIYLHSQPGGINALQLSKAIGVTYKTAWLICHKLRYAMSQAEAETLLGGIVRVSDALMYKVIGFPRNYMDVEQPVFVASMENENGDITRIKLRISPRQLRKDHIDSPDDSAFVRSVVEPESFPHAIVQERYFSKPNRELKRISLNAERWLARTFRGIGTKHLQVYLEHYCYIENRSGNSSTLALVLLQDCVRRTGIDYPTLIGLKDRRSVRPTRTKHVSTSIAV